MQNNDTNSPYTWNYGIVIDWIELRGSILITPTWSLSNLIFSQYYAILLGTVEL